jgi:hypothetical protein
MDLNKLKFFNLNAKVTAAILMSLSHPAKQYAHRMIFL